HGLCTQQTSRIVRAGERTTRNLLVLRQKNGSSLTELQVLHALTIVPLGRRREKEKRKKGRMGEGCPSILAPPSPFLPFLPLQVLVTCSLSSLARDICFCSASCSFC